MVIEGRGPMLFDDNNNNNNINNNNNNPAEAEGMGGANGVENSHANLPVDGAVVPVADSGTPVVEVEIKEIGEADEETSAYARRLMAAGLEAVRATIAELSVRDQIAKAVLKRDIKLNSLWTFSSYANAELQLNEMNECRDLFLLTHPETETHRLLKKAFEMVELSSVRSLVRLSHRFKIRITDIDDRMESADRPIIDFDGWREEVDEDSNQHFVNNEGLIRMDMPAGWYTEEFDRERRYEDCKMDITNTEAFAIERLDILLEKISKELEECREVVGKIDQELYIEYDQELEDARNLLAGVVENVCTRVLDHFFYEAPCPIIDVPQYGITHAYHQRMMRYRPTYITELEEYFDDEDN